MFTSCSKRLIAWIALFAVLFGGVSPAIAAGLFFDRADILGRMLAIPVAMHHYPAPQEASSEDDGCPHESGGHAAHGDAHSGHPGSSSQDTNDESGHAAHGIFCSFCLTVGATVALLAPAAAIWNAAKTTDCFVPAGQEQRPAGVLTSTRHPRDPPFPS